MYGDGYEGYYYPPPPPRRPVGGPQAAVLALVLAVVLFFVFGGSLPSIESNPAPGPASGAVPQAPVVPSGECKVVPGKPKDTTWGFLRGNGLSRPLAAGVMGNIQAESGFNPDIVERQTGVGYGLAQWSYGRRAALEQAARDQKVPKSDICFQLRYLIGELKVRTTDEPEYKKWPTEWEMLIHMPNEAEALVAFHHEFERSQIMNIPDPARRRQAVIDQRFKFVQEALNNPSFQ